MHFGLRPATAASERLDPGQVRAVGAGARRDLGMAVEQQRGALGLQDAASALMRLIRSRSPAA